MDSYTFCEALGPEVGNKWMQAHWKSWITEQYMDELQKRKVERIRLPIGDWTINPYGPYIGCMDGAKEWIDKMMDWCAHRNITVLLDVHTARGSQNGFDNGGLAFNTSWINQTHFDHWDHQSTGWANSPYDIHGNAPDASFDNSHVNYAHLKWTLDQAEGILKRWGSHSALIGFEPINEPFKTNKVVLKDFYRQARKLVQNLAPQAYFVFQEGFDPSWDQWHDLFDANDVDKVAIDTHGYLAWNAKADKVEDYCKAFDDRAKGFENFTMEVWWGEWALATDVCATYLGGFQDANTEPQFDCRWIDCPASYLPDDFDGKANATTPDASIEAYTPIGLTKTGDAEAHAHVQVSKGKCTDDSKYFDHGNVTTLAHCIRDSFAKYIDAQFIWTARNEIEAKWSYVWAWDMGWINTTVVTNTTMLESNPAWKEDHANKTLPQEFNKFIQ